MTPFRTSLKKMKKQSIPIIEVIEKNYKPRYELGQLVRTAAFKNILKSGSTNWPSKIYKTTDVIQ